MQPDKQIYLNFDIIYGSKNGVVSLADVKGAVVENRRYVWRVTLYQGSKGNDQK